MECFYHEGRAAVGTCRSCLRGVCRDCGVDLERGLACRDRCEAVVRDLLAMIDQSVQLRGVSSGILRASRGLWLALSVVSLAVGVFVGAWGLTLPAFREISLLGIPFLVVGAAALRTVRHVRDAQRPAG